MHICFVCNEYPPFPHGGIGSFVQTLGRALVQLGHQITVVGMYPEDWQGKTIDNGVHVIRLPYSKLPIFKFVENSRKLLSTLKSINSINPIDIVEANELGFAFFPSKSSWIKVLRMQGGHHYYSLAEGKQPHTWRSFQEKLSFGKADAICSVSNTLAQITKELLHLEKTKIEVIPNPVDTELFHPQEHIQEMNGLITFVGTIVEKKGVFQLIRAMPRVISKVPNAQLWFIGRSKVDKATGRQITEIMWDQMDDSIRSHIHFKGIVPHEDLPQILAQSQVLIFPSNMEAFGIVFIEGMAMGKATIVGNNGAGPEIVLDGHTGLLCDPLSPDSIAEKIITVLTDNELRFRLQTGARLRAVQQFDIQIISKLNEDFYKKLL